MTNLQLKVITPKKIVREEEVRSVTVPSAEGELTILPRHMRLLALLKEGIVTIRTDKAEDYISIGGGYVETDGKSLNILVSRAFGQDEINEKLTQEAIAKAERVIQESKDEKSIHEATILLRHAAVDLKLLKKRRQRPPSVS